MSLDSHKIFNPRYHVVDLVSAFTRFQRKFGYIYEGENRTAPSTATTPETVAEWKDQDKAKYSSLVLYLMSSLMILSLQLKRIKGQA